MRIFRNKRQAALSTAPGMYAEEDPAKVIFETSTRLKLKQSLDADFVRAGCVAAGLSGRVSRRRRSPA